MSSNQHTLISILQISLQILSSIICWINNFSKIDFISNCALHFLRRVKKTFLINQYLFQTNNKLNVINIYILSFIESIIPLFCFLYFLKFFSFFILFVLYCLLKAVVAAARSFFFYICFSFLFIFATIFIFIVVIATVTVKIIIIFSILLHGVFLMMNLIIFTIFLIKMCFS